MVVAKGTGRDWRDATGSGHPIHLMKEKLQFHLPRNPTAPLQQRRYPKRAAASWRNASSSGRPEHRISWAKPEECRQPLSREKRNVRWSSSDSSWGTGHCMKAARLGFDEENRSLMTRGGQFEYLDLNTDIVTPERSGNPLILPRHSSDIFNTPLSLTLSRLDAAPDVPHPHLQTTLNTAASQKKASNPSEVPPQRSNQHSQVIPKRIWLADNYMYEVLGITLQACEQGAGKEA
ncbi:hypothetical protein SODALDRAFT_353931 [Sodiomyces alkalinus F11]|uniref:Uncharacterized protein n=1 Tax=Sodiomyces alkalinus (strain CBS 110278 / VKM F-3762 / F11) TaxID=1314773 RepID=A0A3N2Q535_SODAK|nr:hypothetical protein SODALDRAFT_353931 [Sodiomyces alkalinus F11]ROT41816.1 hypothetical protein SODALDRAFT_353931 [Sodiomyces alkalinus F11]